MIKTLKNWRQSIVLLGVSLVLVAGLGGAPALAADTTQNPQSGSVGLEGTISTAPPSRAATIATPSNGATFTTLPVTVAGICPSGVLVKVFSNNVFVGSTTCPSGSYTLQVDLFGGSNQLISRVYDALDQAGPDSAPVTVTYNDANFAQFSTVVTLTSVYARRGADPGSQLDWPLILNGGTGPYAISVDWGDGSPSQLQSLTYSGDFTVSHKYTNSGVYKAIVKATDHNGTSAYLQLVAVANGAIQTGNGNSTATAQLKTVVLWWPILMIVPLLFAAFWLGRRHQLYVLRRRIEEARDQ